MRFLPPTRRPVTPQVVVPNFMRLVSAKDTATHPTGRGEGNSVVGEIKFFAETLETEPGV
jgi:hypothetical protein